MKVTLTLTARDKLIIATALSYCPLAELGDTVGGDDSQTAIRLIELAYMFDEDTASFMVERRAMQRRR